MKNIPNERKKFIWISTILSYMDLPKYCFDIYKIIDPHLSCSEKSYLRGMCHTVYQLKTYSSFPDEIGKHDVSIFRRLLKIQTKEERKPIRIKHMKRDEVDDKPPESNSPLNQVTGRDVNHPAKTRSQT